MTKRINVILPEQTVSVLDRVTTKGNRSRFISLAVHYYVENQGKQSLAKQLKAGYVANAERNLGLAAEWFSLEEEASTALKASRAQNNTHNSKRK